MIRRKIIDYKVTVPDISLFVKLGNVFPVKNSIFRLCYHSNGQLNFLGTYFSKFGETLESILDRYISSRRKKTLSNFMLEYIDNHKISKVTDYYTLDASTADNIGIYIYRLYFKKWSNLVDTLNYEYDAIRPYDMYIEDSDRITHGGTTKNNVEDTHNNTQSVTGKNITTDSDSENTASDTTNDNTKNSIYGFNSSNAIPSDVSEYNSKTVEDTIRDSSREFNETRTVTDDFTDSKELIITHGKTINDIRDIIRKGNIGNMAQQDLIKKQREIVDYIIWDTIYDDMDKVLTRSKYL